MVDKLTLDKITIFGTIFRCTINRNQSKYKGRNKDQPMGVRKKTNIKTFHKYIWTTGPTIYEQSLIVLADYFG